MNQLLAALALFVATLYLRRKHAWGWVLTLVPCLFMLVITVWAVVLNENRFLAREVTATFPAYQKWSLAVVNGLTLVLALWLVVEAMVVFFRPSERRDTPAAAAQA